MMNLVKWNPGREMATLNNQISRFFDESFFPTRWLDDDSGVGSWNPKVDIYENDNNFVIKAELPGLEKKDVSIDVQDRVLTLKGERKLENEVKEDNYYRREMSYGRFQRAFTLPANVDSDKITADFKDGLLKIEVPKPEEAKPKNVSIQ
jgi:HSP20 family protein